VQNEFRAPALPQGQSLTTDLRRELRKRLAGRVCLLGLGNEGLGDDGFGVRLAEALQAAGQAHVHVAGATPERWLARNGLEAVDHLVFLDAVDFGGAPGAVVFVDAGQMATRFPQVSTHKLSLGLLAKWAEANGRTQAWLLGVQLASLRPSAALTPAVQLTLDLLKELLSESPAARGATEPGRADAASARAHRLRQLAPINHQPSAINHPHPPRQVGGYAARNGSLACSPPPRP
jgi:hydrogenase 3 maturation protease